MGSACFALCSVASALSFVFTGSGEVTPSGPPDGAGNLPLTVINTAYDFPGSGVWNGASNFVFNLGSQAGTGIFSFSHGADSLSGTLATAAATVAGRLGFELSYTVASGTGAYAGFSGDASSLVQLLGDPAAPPTPFLEAGIMSLVPEPAIWMLALVGLAALGKRQLHKR